MTKTILHIDSSIFGDQGMSSQLSAYLIEKLTAQLQSFDLIHHSLAEQNIPHFQLSTIQGTHKGNNLIGDNYIRELQKAELVIISAPMYNFAVPSQLKSWFDHVTRAGLTFKYSESGPIGLLENKKVYVITTRGGLHRNKDTDTETAWLKTILNFIGLTDIEFIFAEGLNMSDHKEKAMHDAKTQIDRLIQDLSEVA